MLEAAALIELRPMPAPLQTVTDWWLDLRGTVFEHFSGVAGLRVLQPLGFRSAALTRRSAGGAAGGSLLQAVTLQVYQLLDPAREVPAEAVHIELCVDIRAALAQACAECGRRLFPAPRRQSRLQATAQPRHGGFM